MPASTLIAEELSDIYYLSLLHHVGCTGAAVFAAQVAEGDDLALFGTFAASDHDDRMEILGASITRLGRDRDPFTRGPLCSTLRPAADR